MMIYHKSVNKTNKIILYLKKEPQPDESRVTVMRYGSSKTGTNIICEMPKMMKHKTNKTKKTKMTWLQCIRVI